MYSSSLAAVSALAEAPPPAGVTQLPTPNEEFSSDVICCVCTVPAAVNVAVCPSFLVCGSGLAVRDTVTVYTCN